VLDEDIKEVQGYVNPDNVLDRLDGIDNVLDEELEEVEPNVGKDVLDDDIDNDDDLEMDNPLNMNFELDDIDD
jgi:hypothetical protein